MKTERVANDLMITLSVTDAAKLRRELGSMAVPTSSRACALYLVLHSLDLEHHVSHDVPDYVGDVRSVGSIVGAEHEGG
jgi:hypothetical protein